MSQLSFNLVEGSTDEDEEADSDLEDSEIAGEQDLWSYYAVHYW